MESWREIFLRRLTDGTAWTEGFTDEELNLALVETVEETGGPVQGYTKPDDMIVATVEDRLVVKGTTEYMVTVYYALAEYRDKLVDDLATCYHGDKGYTSAGDDMFLGGKIGEIARIMYEIENATKKPLATAARKVYKRED